MQMVFQDPYSSLNPRMTDRSSDLREVLRFHKIVPSDEIGAKSRALLSLVGLSAADRRSLAAPAQRRAAPARRDSPARSPSGPRFLVLDEPVAALDVSIQAQILNLLQ